MSFILIYENQKGEQNVMKLMQKLMKKNNKGFSLVELIVVILIIGVLAVAIAPQVTKWVGRAETSQQTNEEAQVMSATQVAAADYYAKENAAGTAISFTVGTDSSVSSCTPTTFKPYIEEVLSGTLKESHTVSVSTDGAVTVN